MRKLIILLLLSLPAFAQENLNNLILKLGDENFEVRQQASSDVKRLNPPIKQLLLLSKEYFERDPEISYRLKEIAKYLFTDNLRDTDERILSMLGDLDANIGWTYFMTDVDGLTRFTSPGGGIISIDSLSPLAKTLKHYDIIIEINGISWIKFIEKKQSFKGAGNFLLGRTYTLTIIRPLDTDPIEERGHIDFHLDKFEVLEIEAPSTMRKPDQIDYKLLNEIIEEEWLKFFNSQN